MHSHQVAGLGVWESLTATPFRDNMTGMTCCAPTESSVGKAACPMKSLKEGLCNCVQLDLKDHR